MAKYDKADLERRMKGAVESLRSDLGGLRTGRANTALLDPIMVEAYGNSTPLNQVATVSAPEPRMLSVQVWDKSNVLPVEKAIRSAGLGLNPINDGNNIRLPIPDLTEDRRKELAKLAHSYAEKARIAIRNVRRDGMDNLKADENKKEISEDERKRHETEVQKLTDELIKDADAVAAQKEQEIMGGEVEPAAERAPRYGEPRVTSPSSWMATGAGPRRGTCRAWSATSAGWRRCASWSAPPATWGWKR